MSPQDAMFISVEDERNPMHIGNVSVFEGPAPSYGDLVRTVASHLPFLPRYSQRVRFVPMGLGRPVWVDDPHFQILYHIRHTATPAPGSAEELRNLAGRDGNWALISKVHHCIVDGVSASDDRAKLNFVHRMVYTMPAMKKLFTDGDFRDWDEIDTWAKSIAASLVPAGVS